MKRKIAYLCLALACGLMGYAIVSAKANHFRTVKNISPPTVTLTDLDVLAKARVVKIVNHVREGTMFGTGWILMIDGKTFVVTNRHVCGEFHNVRIQLEKDNFLYDGLVVRLSKVADLCLIVSEQSMVATLGGYELAKKAPTTNDFVYVYGYAHGGPLMRVYSHYLRNDDLPLMEEWGPQSYNLGLIDGEIFPGNSGSPVLNTRGEVVGVAVCTGSDPKDHRQIIGGFVKLTQLLDFLTFNEGPVK